MASVFWKMLNGLSNFLNSHSHPTLEFLIHVSFIYIVICINLLLSSMQMIFTKILVFLTKWPHTAKTWVPITPGKIHHLCYVNQKPSISPCNRCWTKYYMLHNSWMHWANDIVEDKMLQSRSNLQTPQLKEKFAERGAHSLSLCYTQPYAVHIEVYTLFPRGYWRRIPSSTFPLGNTQRAHPVITT